MGVNKEKVIQSCPTQSLHGLDRPWNSPGKNTGVGSLSLLQVIFPTQGSNPSLPYCRWFFTSWSRSEAHKQRSISSIDIYTTIQNHFATSPGPLCFSHLIVLSSSEFYFPRISYSWLLYRICCFFRLSFFIKQYIYMFLSCHFIAWWLILLYCWIIFHYAYMS